jgi:transposase
VLDPVFGNDVRLWEAGIEGWREELIQFLPFWIQRSRDIVETFDATPLDLTEEVFAEKVDPYLLEHGSSRQKKDALKHSSDVCLT